MEFNRDEGTSSQTAKILSSPDALANQASACPAHGPTIVATVAYIWPRECSQADKLGPMLSGARCNACNNYPSCPMVGHTHHHTFPQNHGRYAVLLRRCTGFQLNQCAPSMGFCLRRRMSHVLGGVGISFPWYTISATVRPVHGCLQRSRPMLAARYEALFPRMLKKST